MLVAVAVSVVVVEAVWEAVLDCDPDPVWVPDLVPVSDPDCVPLRVPEMDGVIAGVPDPDPERLAVPV